MENSDNSQKCKQLLFDCVNSPHRLCYADIGGLDAPPRSSVLVLEACAIRLLFVAFFPKVELMCSMIHSCKVYNVMAVGTAVGLHDRHQSRCQEVFLAAIQTSLAVITSAFSPPTCRHPLFCCLPLCMRFVWTVYSSRIIACGVSMTASLYLAQCFQSSSLLFIMGNDALLIYTWTSIFHIYLLHKSSEMDGKAGFSHPMD